MSTMAEGTVATQASKQQERRAAELAALKAKYNKSMANMIDESEATIAAEIPLPGGTAQAAEEAAVEIVAQMADEFTCASCFMVRHRSQLAREEQGQKFCTECEG